jgi:uncharacterized peroxidase-related enzyme
MLAIKVFAGGDGAMSFLRETGPGDERDRLYEADRAAQGYVSNHTKVFARRPAVLEAWRRLNTAIKAEMDPRWYELATLAAARGLRSSYCALAHGMVLRDRFYDADTVRAIATGDRAAGIGPADAAIIDFAERVATGATGITADDVGELRRQGLSDDDVFQVVLAAAARCFFSTVLDAVGAEPDAEYRTTIEPDLRVALTFGRPVATEP